MLTLDALRFAFFLFSAGAGGSDPGWRSRLYFTASFGPKAIAGLLEPRN